MSVDFERIGKIVIETLGRKECLHIYRHLEGLNVSAKFSDDRKLRYVLDVQEIGTTEGNTVCAIMQNPSYANEDIADKSVNFLEQLIFKEKFTVFTGVKRLIIVNLFAYILTESFQGEPNQIGAENDLYIGNAIAESEIVLIAWGASKKHPERILHINEILKKHQDKKLYTTKKHPSRGELSEDFIIDYHI